MPIVSNIYYTLTQSQNSTRVKLEVAGTTPVNVLVGDPAEGWTDGCYIEVARAAATADVFITPYDGTVTLNLMSGTNVLRDGEYARVSLISPGVWDVHVYPSVQQIVNNDVVIVFQVGAPTVNHSHIAALTTAQATALIQGTNTSVPVADAAQPSVVLTSQPYSGDSHTHDITVFFDYVNAAFIVTDITNNALDNHFADVVGRATMISTLADVDAPSPDTGYILAFDALSSKWVAITPSLKPAPLETVTVSGTALDFGSGADHNTHFRYIGAGNLQVTVRPDLFFPDNIEFYQPNPGTSPMPQGGTAIFGNHGGGTVTFVAAPGVTINTPDTLSITRPQGKATLIKAGPNEWDLEGNIGT